MRSARLLVSAPMCARCGRRVDHFFEEQDVDFDRLRFTAICHGERQSVTLEGREVAGAIDFGLAFVETPLLAAGASP